MIPAAASASTAASSSGSVSWDPWPPQRARNASQAPAKHFFFSHISCPNFSKNLSRHSMDKQQREYIHHLMLQYSDAMVRLTYRRVGDWHLAEDLVQETFLTACCKSERVCAHKKPVAWLFETLNNLTLRESRRFYHTEVSIEDIAESHELTELPMTCHIPMGLSALEQEIILLRIDKGLSFLELAEHFGISEMACRQRLSRALRKCRTLLEDPLGSTQK